MISVRNERKKDFIKSFIPLFIIFVILEALSISGWTGPYKYEWKWLAAYVTPYVALLIICAIPICRKIIIWCEDRLVAKLKGLKEYPWKKNAIVVAIDLAVAFAAERILEVATGKGITYFSIKRLLFVFAIIFLVSLAIVYREMMVKRVELAVFIIILTIGTTFVGVLPAACGLSWDDETHYKFALQMSHVTDIQMTTADAQVLSQFPRTALEHYLFNEAEVDEWVEMLDAEKASGNHGPYGRLYPQYEKLCYVSQALGLIVARGLHLPFHIEFQFGQWCNLFVYALILYYAIKRLKSGKMIAAVVSLLAPCMLMATTYSRDPWMLSLVIYSFCYYISEVQQPDKKLQWYDMALMLGSMFIGVGAKAVYGLLILFLITMPGKKFEKKWHRLIFIVASIALTIIAFATVIMPMFATSGAAIQDSRGGEAVDSGNQMEFILGYPGEYFKILWRFCWEYISFSNAKNNLTFLAYLGNARFPVIIMMLMAFTAITDHIKEDKNISIASIVLFVILGCVTVAIIATSMYVAFTPYMHETVLGCQYRYMVHLFFPALYLLGSLGRGKIRLSGYWYNTIVLGISSLVLFEGLWSLYLAAF